MGASRPLSWVISSWAISLCVACNSGDEAAETGPYAAETQATGWGEDDGGLDPEAACIVNGELQRPLWALESAEHRVVLHQPGVAPLELAIPEFAGGWSSVDVSATHVAAAYIADDAIVRLFERTSGELVWERRYVGSGLGTPFVDDHGRVLLGYVDYMQMSMALGYEGGLWLREDGDVELRWVHPVGPVNEDGWAPAFFLEPDDLSSDQRLTGWGWVAPATGAKLVLAEELFSPPGMRIEDDAFEYIDVHPEHGLRLLHAAFEASRWVPLSTAEHAGVVNASDRWRLLDLRGPDERQSFARVSIVDGELLEFEMPTPPAGFEVLGAGCLGPQLGIDARGRVLLAVRDGDAAWIGAWDPETDEWSLIGLPMIEIDGVDIIGVWGEYVYVAGFTEPSCDSEPFVDPPDDALIGSGYQLVGVDSGLALPVGQRLAIDDQRVCATWWTNAARIVYDLEDGDELELPSSTQAGWFD
ncbi:MAG: hypothetical protein R6X02_09100 [Enhygromyxa sp.]